jgi:uncharacterized protein YuzE
MRESYLEVTFRFGRPIAAYYYLPRHTGDKSVRTVRIEPGLVVDYSSEGKPLGIEITAPEKVTIPVFNRVLKAIGFPAVRRTDLAPLKAA